MDDDGVLTPKMLEDMAKQVMAPLKMKESYGIGVMHPKGVAVAKDIGIDSDWPRKAELKDFNQVMLLPRTTGSVTFTNDQLKEFADDAMGKEFDIDRLIDKYGNTQLEEYRGQKAIVKSTVISDRGLSATVNIPSVYKQEGAVPANLRISDDLIADGQWDLISSITQAAAKAVAKKTEQEIFKKFQGVMTPEEARDDLMKEPVNVLSRPVVKFGEVNQNGTVYSQQGSYPISSKNIARYGLSSD